jgi:DNA polymerase-3 subunit epsilon
LERVARSKLANPYVDTVSMARRKFPGQRASLDALCERFGIDNAHRTKHGALLDAEILAEVYLELIGGRQAQLGLAESVERRAKGSDGAVVQRERIVALAPRINDADRDEHRKFVASLGENAVWRNYQ